MDVSGLLCERAELQKKEEESEEVQLSENSSDTEARGSSRREAGH